jgi:4-hydroxy-tetrahydrodipicolinate synthase
MHVMSSPGTLDYGGVYSVLPTPFTADGVIDEGSLRRVVDLFVKAGVHGFTALGVTSEVSRLDESERAHVLEVIVDQVGGRVPVVAGATAEGTRTCIAHAREAKARGAAAVMVSPPRLPKLNSDAVVKHFHELASAVDLPIVVQDYPPVSGYAMEPSLLVRIAREIPVARTIKLEDAPTPFKTSRIIALAEGLPLQILGGLGGTYLLEELMAGAAGAMTGFAYPEMLIEIVRAYRAGRPDEAADRFYRYVPLMRFEFQETIGMAIRKDVLRRRGAIASAAVRAPAASLDAGTLAALERLLRWMRDSQGVPWISV